MTVFVNEPMIWIDLEMTGLDSQKNTILEIASVITDNNLKIIAIGPEIVIKQKKDFENDMNEWCKDQHRKSGLLEKVEKSTVSIEEAENQTLKFFKKYCHVGKSPLCGNSVWVDRLFLKSYMPKIENFLHYRNIDVSTIKELAMRWNGVEFKKTNSHRANDDIIESIEELKFYKKDFFKLK